MFKTRNILIILILGLGVVVGGFLILTSQIPAPETTTGNPDLPLAENEGGLEPATLDPMAIESLKTREYPGSDITIEQTLADKSNYKQYIVSYLSDGLKIYALMTVPKTPAPEGGYPAIVFNHGSIPPDQYRTAERYMDYVNYFARNGYVVFKSDYRGHGESEGEAVSPYSNEGDVIDVMNAFYSVQKYPGVNPEKIGMWGHSSGGHITTIAMIITEDIKAGVIWGGLTASYDERFAEWRARRRRQTSSTQSSFYRRQSQILEEKYGPPSQSSAFWRSVNPYNYLYSITAPIQLHHGSADATVPVSYSEYLKSSLEENGKQVELIVYDGADHNIAGNAFGKAMANSLAFFDKYLK